MKQPYKGPGNAVDGVGDYGAIKGYVGMHRANWSQESGFNSTFHLTRVFFPYTLLRVLNKSTVKHFKHIATQIKDIPFVHYRIGFNIVLKVAALGAPTKQYETLMGIFVSLCTQQYFHLKVSETTRIWSGHVLESLSVLCGSIYSPWITGPITLGSNKALFTFIEYWPPRRSNGGKMGVTNNTKKAVAISTKSWKSLIAYQNSRQRTPHSILTWLAVFIRFSNTCFFYHSVYI